MYKMSASRAKRRFDERKYDDVEGLMRNPKSFEGEFGIF